MALKTGRASLAWNAAIELEHIDLDDALALVLLVVDEPRFSRAAARWLGRVCTELPVTLAQAQLLGAALAAFLTTAPRSRSRPAVPSSAWRVPQPQHARCASRRDAPGPPSTRDSSAP